MERFFNTLLNEEQKALNSAKDDRDRLFGVACRAGSGADADTQCQYLNHFYKLM